MSTNTWIKQNIPISDIVEMSDDIMPRPPSEDSHFMKIFTMHNKYEQPVILNKLPGNITPKYPHGMLEYDRRRDNKIPDLITYYNNEGVLQVRENISNSVVEDLPESLQPGGKRKSKKSRNSKKTRKTRSKIQRGGGVNEEKLWKAMWTGDLENVDKALDAGADVNACDNDGNTALILACIAGMRETERLNIVKTLIKHGADVVVSNNYKITALMYVCQYGDIPVIDELIKNIEPELDRIAYVNAKDEYGGNVINVVDEFLSPDPEKFKDVLRVLIKAGLTGADELINEYEYSRDLIQPLYEARDISRTRQLGRISSALPKPPPRTRTKGGRSMKRGDRKTKKTKKTKKSKKSKKSKK